MDMKQVQRSSIPFFFILAVMTTWIAGASAWDWPHQDWERPHQDWEIKLTADDLPAAADFGRSVATDGNLVALGAGGADAGPVSGAGAVYLFKRCGLRYVLEDKLIAPDATPGAEFGRAVAIQGNRVIVGARFAQVEAFSKAGAVYVFRKVRGSWLLEAKIASPTPADEDNFGRALDIQGEVLVVTARKENLNASDVGAAYVFRHGRDGWVFDAKITASDPAPGAYFGQSVDMQGDLMAIGARNADPNGAGAFYLFARSGHQWKELAKVPSPDGATDDQFGFTLAVSGNLIAVGARRADLPGAKDAGAAYLFAIRKNSVKFVAKLTAGDAKAGDQFGQSIAMDGETIVVGANRADIGTGVDEGAVYLFRRTWGGWMEEEKVTASDGIGKDEFGYSLSAWGNTMAIGAHTANSTEGAVYVMPLEP
jgi:hypothetical protein